MVRLGPRLESTVLRAGMGLPPATVRWLAGRQVLLDGQVLSPETQLMLRLDRITREPDVATLDIHEGRRALRRQCRLVGGEQPIGSTRDLEVSGAEGPLPARL